jgi:hypothetical protein
MADDKIPTTQYGAFATPSPQYSPPATVTAATGRPGYDYDPHDSPGERAEGFFVGKLIGKFTGETDGFCSTSREWHIFLAGISAGLRAGTLEQVPECPPLWQDEMQYFNTPAMVANVVKCQWPGIVTVLGGIAALNVAGIPIPFIS